VSARRERGRASSGSLALAVLLAAGAAATTTDAAAAAGTMYVSDDLVLGVYSEPNGAGQRLATLHSGAAIESVEEPAGGTEYTKVRLADGRVGWVKSSYLTTRVPAAVRVKQLEDELDRRHATTPELAAAAARSELEALKGELAAKDTELAAARAAAREGRSAADASAADPSAVNAAGAPLARKVLIGRPLGWAAALAAALAAGFAAGYATLARRIRQKYGGLKIY
jgi:SH3 domain protein